MSGNKKLVLFVVIFVMLILIGIIIYFVYRANQAEIKSKNEQLREISDNISDSRQNDSSTNRFPDTNLTKKDSAVEEECFVVANRNSFIAEYLGQTESKTAEYLRMHKGKVIFIDEAYSLYRGKEDMYGIHALDIINRFMSENPDTIFIFAGYKDKMKKGIFTVQEGFIRRCLLHLEFDNYSVDELYLIFLNQIARENWTLANQATHHNLRILIKRNYDYFTDNGGDTLKLFTHCKEFASEGVFEATIENYIRKQPMGKSIITSSLLKYAIQELINNYQERTKKKKADKQDRRYTSDLLSKILTT
jgi:hypothetical protein